MNSQKILRAIGLTLAAIAGSADANGQVVKSMSPAFPNFQPGCPFQVVGVNLNTQKHDLADAVVLVNVSDRRISGYQLGWVLTDKETAGPGAAYVSPFYEADVQPGGVIEAGSLGIGFNAAAASFKAAGIQNGVVMIGVVHVKFRDGGDWSYPLTTRRKFESQPDLQLLERLRPVLNDLKEKRRQQGAARNEAPVCTSFGGPFRPLFASVSDWLRIRAARADCTECWIPVCNPGAFLCYSYGFNCYTESCYPGDCNIQQCAIIPTCCPGCGCY